MGRHAKEQESAPYISTPEDVSNTSTMKIDEIRQLVTDVNIIDKSTQKHPIPKPSVTE